MRICLIASSRFPIREPFHGGLEAHTATLAQRLQARGHEVSVFAAPGSDPAFTTDYLDVEEFVPSATARHDVGAQPERWMSEHHAYLRLMLDLAESGRSRFDLVHNNSLHHLPVAMARALRIPVLTSLHTPPIPWLESAIRLSDGASRFTAVSRATAAAWRHVVDAAVVRNGIDTDRWRPGPGGGPVVWSGRLVPEKAPHLALDAARAADREIVLAGPAPDPVYFAAEVAPRLGRDAVWAGHLRGRELIALVGSASVAVVSPVWDEPFGLVAAEAMSCGTPVAAFARGGLCEIVRDGVGVLARPDDVTSLAAAIEAASRLDRHTVRAHAEAELGLETMVDGYERLYRSSTLAVAS